MPESSLFIGKRNAGQISNYYLGEIISDEEVAAVQAAAEKIGIDVLNTRLVNVNISRAPCPTAFIRVRKNGDGDFTLLVASANPQPQAEHMIDFQSSGAKLTVEYGDHADALKKSVAALHEVRPASSYCEDTVSHSFQG